MATLSLETNRHCQCLAAARSHTSRATTCPLAGKTANETTILLGCFYGRPERRYPCARCQVYGVSMFTCRVRRGHSNPDFNLLLNFSNLGGVRGLLAPFFNNPAGTQTEGGSVARPGGGGVAQGNSGDRVSAASVTNGATAEKDASHGNDEQDLEDPRQILQKAQEAWQLANRLINQSQTLADSPVRLSEAFISTHFPFDHSDNHYMYCIVCGLSGDLLCCDGCSNVVHPKCIGMTEIPDGDWFCEACMTKKNGSKKQAASVEATRSDGYTGVKKSAEVAEFSHEEQKGNSDSKTADRPASAQSSAPVTVDAIPYPHEAVKQVDDSDPGQANQGACSNDQKKRA